MMHNLTVDQFRTSYDTGAVLSVTLVANGGAFEIQIETRRGLAQLVKLRPKDAPRRFVDIRKALMLVHELGIPEVRIDSKKWRPDEPERERKPRPDSAQVLKAAHAAMRRSQA